MFNQRPSLLFNGFIMGAICTTITILATGAITNTVSLSKGHNATQACADAGMGASLAGLALGGLVLSATLILCVCKYTSNSSQNEDAPINNNSDYKSAGYGAGSVR